MKKLTHMLCKIILVASVCFDFTACSPVYQTNYSFIPPHAWRGKQCVNRCLRSRTDCMSQCRSQDLQCRNDAKLAAMPTYLAYVERQRKQNLPAYQSVGDFANYSGCSDHCGCHATYRQCYMNCGGQVIANTQCVAFCKKSTVN